MKWKIFLLIGVISIATYANSLRNSFHFDDQHYIVENPYIRDIINIPSFFTSPKYSSFEKTFTSHYRPILVTSYAINYAIGGLNPVGYHIVNLIFHVGAAFLVFLIVQAIVTPTLSLPYQVGGKKGGGDYSFRANRRDRPSVRANRRDRPLGLSSKKDVDVVGQASSNPEGLPYSGFFAALTAALIFAVHPFNSEVVNYITARSSVMCSFFYLSAFYCWVKFREQDSPPPSPPPQGGRVRVGVYFYYIASLLAFVLAMLTKEIAITLPVMLFLYDCYFYRQDVTPTLSLPRYPIMGGGESKQVARGFIPHISTGCRVSIVYYLPYILLVILPYLIYRVHIYGYIARAGTRDFYTNLLTQFTVLLKYLKLLFYPVGLTIEHDIKLSSTIFDLSVIVSLLSLCLVLAAAYLLFKKGGEWRVLSFFIIWFFITLLPTTLIPLNAILQENRGYLAGVGFAVFGGIIIGRLSRISFSESRDRPSGLSRRESIIYIGLLVPLIIVYSPMTIQRNMVWKDDYRLWADVVEKAPLSARAHDNLGLAYIGRGEYDLALAEFKKTLELHPAYYLAYYNAGVVYQLQGRLDMARASYEECIRINPTYFRTYYNVGIVYRKMGELDKAIDAYEKAISLDPRHPFVYNNLGVVLTEKGAFDRAEAIFKRAIEIDPGYVRAYYNLGNLYYSVKDYNRAAGAYKSAIKIEPDYKEAKEMLNLALSAR